MRYLPPADRALDVVAAVVIHRPIGRRLSDVYVDEAMRPARSGKPTQRLSDMVYWRTRAMPGEQIQERSGGMVLVTKAGTCHPIRLSVPEPLHLEIAFAHAERAVRSDLLPFPSPSAHDVTVADALGSKRASGLIAAGIKLIWLGLLENFAVTARSAVSDTRFKIAGRKAPTEWR